MPPPGSPDPQGGFTPPPAPSQAPAAQAPTAAGYDPAAAAGQWASQGFGSANLGNQPVVGVGGRIGARILDSIIVFAIGFIPLMLVFGVMSAIMIGGQDPQVIQNNPELAAQAIGPASTISTLLVMVPIYLINDVVLVKTKGWNLGKVILGQRLVDASSGAFLTWGQAFKRFLVYYSPALVVSIIGIFLSQAVSTLLSLASGFWYIALLVSIAMGGPLFQGWHDKVAGSKVVKKPAF